MYNGEISRQIETQVWRSLRISIERRIAEGGIKVAVCNKGYKISTGIS